MLVRFIGFLCLFQFMAFVVSAQGLQLLTSKKKNKGRGLYSSVSENWKGSTVGGVPLAKVDHWVMTTPQGVVGLTEKKDIRGRPREHVIHFNDRTQSELDYNGDGRIDEWSSMSNDLSIRMYGPAKGHFNVMEVTKTTKDRWVDMLFYRTENGDYRLFASTSRPRTLLFREGQFSDYDSAIPNDFRAGQCSETEVSIQNEVSKFNEKGYSDGELKDVVGAKILHSSCAAMKERSDEVEKLKESLVEVLNSDKSFRTKSNGGATEPEPGGKYVACLRRHKLDVHATRISSALQTKFHDNAWPWQVKCAPPLDLKDGSIKCGSAGMVNDPSTNQKVQQITIYMHAPGSEGFRACMASGEKKDDGDPFREMKRTVFHEMLRYSGIRNTAEVTAIAGCCQEDDMNSPDCDRTKRIVERKLAAQKELNDVLSSFEPGELSQIKRVCEDVYPNEECGQNFKKMLDRSVSESLRMTKHSPACVPNPEAQSCLDALRDMRKKQAEFYFDNERCAARAAGRPWAEKVKAKCEVFNSFVASTFSGIKVEHTSGHCIKSSEPFREGFIQLLMGPFAHARVDVAEVCGLTSKITKVVVRAADTPSDRKPVSLGLEDPRAVMRDSIRDASGKVIAQATDLSQDQVKKLTDSTVMDSSRITDAGPLQRKAFSETSNPERIKRITRDVQMQNALAERVEKFTALPYETLFPKANASESEKERLFEARQLVLPDPLSADTRTLPVVQGSDRSQGSARAEASSKSESNKSSAARAAKPVATGSSSSGKQSSGPQASKKQPVPRSEKLTASGQTNSPRAPASATKPSKKDDPRGRLNLVQRLLRLDAEQLRSELKLDSVRELLFIHRVAVVDESGKSHGPIQDALQWLIFNHDELRLKVMEGR